MKKQNIGFTLSWRTVARRFRTAIVMLQTTCLLLGIPTRHRKVFAIGFNKTATKSIHRVFQNLGMISAHNIRWRQTARTMVFLKYQCFTDGAPDDFTKLDKRFKNSKFILNTRDLDEWIDSRLEHIRATAEQDPSQLSPTWDRTDAAVKHWVLERNRLHLEALDYFRDRPSDLLVLNYIRDSDSGQKIADFLGFKQVAKKQYERSTEKTRDHGALRNEARIHRCLAELGVPESAWTSDIHCPTTSDSTSVWPTDTSSLAYPDVIPPPSLAGH